MLRGLSQDRTVSVEALVRRDGRAYKPRQRQTKAKGSFSVSQFTGTYA